MTIVRRTRKGGFTLVEILIVVIILGILAAIVIPQFTSASQDARKNSLTSQLQTLRSQLELYKLQHLDALMEAHEKSLIHVVTQHLPQKRRGGQPLLRNHGPLRTADIEEQPQRERHVAVRREVSDGLFAAILGHFEIVTCEVVYQLALTVADRNKHIYHADARRELCEQRYYRPREQKKFTAGKAPYRTNQHQLTSMHPSMHWKAAGTRTRYDERKRPIWVPTRIV